MIISHKYQFVFLKTRKTAGTSIEVHLSDHCGEDDVVTQLWPPVEGHAPRNHRGLFNPIPEMRFGDKRTALAQFIKGRRFYNHIPAYKLRGRLRRRVWDNYFKFCVERNPWDKTLSHFHWLKDRYGYNFDEYLRRGNLCQNLPLYGDPLRPGVVLVDRVLRYENLDDELTDVFESLGVPFDGSLTARAKSTKRSDRRPYQEVYNDTQRDIVTRSFADEIQLHEYEF